MCGRQTAALRVGTRESLPAISDPQGSVWPGQAPTRSGSRCSTPGRRLACPAGRPFPPVYADTIPSHVRPGQPALTRASERPGQRWSTDTRELSSIHIYSPAPGTPPGAQERERSDSPGTSQGPSFSVRADQSILATCQNLPAAGFFSFQGITCLCFALALRSLCTDFACPSATARARWGPAPARAGRGKATHGRYCNHFTLY
jgi:hypothetical protein